MISLLLFGQNNKATKAGLECVLLPVLHWSLLGFIGFRAKITGQLREKYSGDFCAQRAHQWKFLRQARRVKKSFSLRDDNKLELYLDTVFL